MVTGACMLMRREQFEAVGGFDENHSIVNNDVDLCLRSWSNGNLIVYEPRPRSSIMNWPVAASYPKTMMKSVSGKVGDLIAAGDPYYHPNLSREHDDYSINVEPI